MPTPDLGENGQDQNRHRKKAVIQRVKKMHSLFAETSENEDTRLFGAG
jgi:hypothetical protein